MNIDRQPSLFEDTSHTNPSELTPLITANLQNLKHTFYNLYQQKLFPQNYKYLINLSTCLHLINLNKQASTHYPNKYIFELAPTIQGRPHPKLKPIKINRQVIYLRVVISQNLSKIINAYYQSYSKNHTPIFTLQINMN